VNSNTLPMIPTGQAQIRLLSPPIAEPKPKAFPTTSRHRICWPAMLSWASKIRSRKLTR
jgi:hypothetical protein